MSNSLENFLNQLGLIENKAVFYRDKKDGLVFKGFSSEMQKKIDIIKPDAYFVFNKQPFILFFDLIKSENSERENEIHKQVWSFDHAPIIFILKNSDVQIFNAFSYSKKNNKLEEINLTDEELNEKFSFWNLQSGATWKNWYQEQYLEIRKGIVRKRANQQLFENIKQVREALTGIRNENKLSDDDANTLILRLIFVRYLIDRGVSIDESYIKGKTTLEKRSNFCQLIENQQRLNDLFDKLNEKFNGVLFKNSDITLTDKQSKDLAQVFNGEMPEEGSLFYGTDSYFEVFDFSIIPVEVISGIYESLIDVETRKLNSAVYTPSFLVEYILNDTVDKFLNENKTADCKIFDPSVGSGVFLVQSLRKMIDKEIELNGKHDKFQFSKRIREIAKNNLFGIDINSQALKVTCFSIYIALLDYQEPKEIDVYKFPNLIDENLFHSDFFDEENLFNDIIKKQNIEFILGNPPWKSNKDDAHINWLKKHKKVTGGFEIAQSFLLRSKDFMQLQTQSALIVTSTIFYNVSKTTRQFKHEFLTTFCIDKFFDLSPVRRLIFEEKNSPASIVYYRLSKDNEHLNNIVKHQSVKSNRFLKYYKMLVIEKYDQKEILQRHFIENDWMFKVALYGNTLDFHFLKKLEKNSLIKLKNLINNKTIFGGAGILKGTPKKHFYSLVGLPINENNQIRSIYTNNSSHFLTIDEVFLEAGRPISIFEGSKILFKEQAENESDVIISYNDGSSVYKKGVFGICSKDKIKINNIYSLLISNLYTYFVYCISGSWGTSTRPQIRWNEEYLSFPFIEPNEEKKKELVDLVNQFLLPYKEYYKEFILGEPMRDELVFDKINDAINELYGVKDYEKDLIDYVLDVSRYQFQESKQSKFTKSIHTDIPFLEKYANVYVDEFSKIYPDEHLQVEVYPLEHFIAMNFVFHKVKPVNNKSIIFPDKKDEKAILKRLANNLSISQITNAEDSSKNLYIQKDIKGFEENSFYIIKPNELKCWHRAMAWYDVAEFKDVIENAELNQLKGDSDGF